MVILQLWGGLTDILNISGHRLGTMEIESALVAYEDVARSCCNFKRKLRPTEQSIVAFVILKSKRPENFEGNFGKAKILQNWVAAEIGPIAS